MSKLPILSGRKLVKILAKIGFIVHHQKGSHIVLRFNKPPYTRIVVPDHREIKKRFANCHHKTSWFNEGRIYETNKEITLSPTSSN